MLALLGCSSDPKEKTAAERGAESYAKYCALCHGDRGQGYTADNANALAHPEFLATVTDEALRRAIARGRPGTTMSPWGSAYGGPLEDAAVGDLVVFLRRWQSAPTNDVHARKVTGELSRGEPVYDANCKDCHGARGVGGQYMTVANPEFLFTASDGYLRHAIEKGRLGTPMAPYAETLTPQQIDDLVVLIRSWQRPTSDVVPTLPDPNAPAVLNPSGPEPALGDGRFVSVDVVKKELDRGVKIVLLDARPPFDYTFEHIAGAISVPFYDVDKHLARLPKDVWIVAYCACPHAESGSAIDALARNGYTKGKVLDEGVAVWKARGYPMKSGPNP
jgi:cytochrome c oxidase cbb3-type subunit 3/ubiquinol-cytochrome c reductase cytochrome c subunit